MSRPYPRRSRPVHFSPVERPNQSVILFVTVCADNRRRLFAREQAVVAILGAWRDADAWLVGRYVIMPDHLHLFCSPASAEAPPLAGWVRFWKPLISRRWPFPGENPIWQASHWDRQLRDARHYGDRWEYVRDNPVRAGLVATADEWPWQGELNQFRFHDVG